MPVLRERYYSSGPMKELKDKLVLFASTNFTRIWTPWRDNIHDVFSRAVLSSALSGKCSPQNLAFFSVLL